MESVRISGFEKYRQYVRALLEEEYGFNEDEVNDILQQLEIAKLEASARGADVDKTYGILRKVLISCINRRIKERSELVGVRHLKLKESGIVSDDMNANAERLEDIFSTDEVDDYAVESYIREFGRLSKKEQGIIHGRFLKEQMTKEDVLEYTDVIAKLTDRIADKDPELANYLYDKLCHIENPQK